MRRLQCLTLVVLTCLVVTEVSRSEPLSFTINTKKWSHLLDDHFISVTVNPTDLLLGRPFGLGMNSTLEILKGLSPAYIRFGSADSKKYSFKKSRYPSNTIRTGDEYIITENHWVAINEMAKTAGLDIIVCLNSAQGDGTTNKWDTRNSLDLISFSDSQGYNLTWQLGYEVQSSEDLTGIQFGKDLTRLRTILNAFPRYQNAKLIGPDIKVLHRKEDADFISEMLIEAGPILNAVTWHPRWPQPSKMKIADLSELGYEFPTDYLEWDKMQLNKILQRSIFKNPIWIGESKTENTGTFAEGILWARRLALAARNGIEVVMKQPSMMDISHPKPEYWVALLHKRTMGKSVLETRPAANNSEVLVTTHCTNSNYFNNIEEGALSVYTVNIGGSEQKVNIRAGWSGRNQKIYQYLLTSGTDPDSVFSQMTYMNGEPLMMTEDGLLPEIKPIIRKADRGVTLRLPPYSVGFWVLPEARVRICQMQPLTVPVINLETLNPANMLKTTQKSIQSIRNINQFIVDTLTNPIVEDDLEVENEEPDNYVEDETAEKPYERRIRRSHDFNLDQISRDIKERIDKINGLLQMSDGQQQYRDAILPSGNSEALRAAEKRLDNLANEVKHVLQSTNQEQEFGKFLELTGLTQHFGNLMKEQRGAGTDAQNVKSSSMLKALPEDSCSEDDKDLRENRPKRQLLESEEGSPGNSDTTSEDQFIELENHPSAIGSKQISVKELEDRYKQLISNHIGKGRRKLEEIKEKAHHEETKIPVKRPPSSKDIQEEILVKEIEVLEKTEQAVSEIIKNQKIRQETIEDIIKDELHEIKNDRIMALEEIREQKQAADGESKNPKANRRTKRRNKPSKENEGEISSGRRIKRHASESEEKSEKLHGLKKAAKDEDEGSVETKKEDPSTRTNIVRKLLIKQGDRAKERTTLRSKLKESYDRIHKKQVEVSESRDKKEKTAKVENSNEETKSKESEDEEKKSSKEKNEKNKEKEENSAEDKKSKEEKSKHVKKNKSNEDNSKEDKSEEDKHKENKNKGKKESEVYVRPPLNHDAALRSDILKSISGIVDDYHDKKNSFDEDISDEAIVDPIKKISKRKPRTADEERTDGVPSDSPRREHPRLRQWRERRLRARQNGDAENGETGGEIARRRRLTAIESKRDDDAERNKIRERIASKLRSRLAPKAGEVKKDEEKQESDTLVESTPEIGEQAQEEKVGEVHEEKEGEQANEEKEGEQAHEEKEGEQAHDEKEGEQEQANMEGAEQSRRRKRYIIQQPNLSSEERIRQFKNAVGKRVMLRKDHLPRPGMNADDFLSMAGSTVRVMFDDVIPEAYDQTKGKIRELGIADYFKEFGKIVEQMKNLDEVFVHIGEAAVKSYLKGERSDHIQSISRIRRSLDEQDTPGEETNEPVTTFIEEEKADTPDTAGDNQNLAEEPINLPEEGSENKENEIDIQPLQTEEIQNAPTDYERTSEIPYEEMVEATPQAPLQEIAKENLDQVEATGPILNEDIQEDPNSHENNMKSGDEEIGKANLEVGNDGTAQTDIGREENVENGEENKPEKMEGVEEIKPANIEVPAEGTTNAPESSATATNPPAEAIPAANEEINPENTANEETENEPFVEDLPKGWKPRRFPIHRKFDRDAALKHLKHPNKVTKGKRTIDSNPNEQLNVSPWLQTTKEFIQQAMTTLQRQKELSELVARENFNNLMNRELSKNIVDKRDIRRKSIVKRQLIPVYDMTGPNKKREVPLHPEATSPARLLRELQPGVYVVPTEEMTNLRSEHVETDGKKPNVVTLNIYYDKKSELAAAGQNQQAISQHQASQLMTQGLPQQIPQQMPEMTSHQMQPQMQQQSQQQVPQQIQQQMPQQTQQQIPQQITPSLHQHMAQQTHQHLPQQMPHQTPQTIPQDYSRYYQNAWNSAPTPYQPNQQYLQYSPEKQFPEPVRSDTNPDVMQYQQRPDYQTNSLGSNQIPDQQIYSYGQQDPNYSSTNNPAQEYPTSQLDPRAGWADYKSSPNSLGEIMFKGSPAFDEGWRLQYGSKHPHSRKPSRKHEHHRTYLDKRRSIGTEKNDPNWSELARSFYRHFLTQFPDQQHAKSNEETSEETTESNSTEDLFIKNRERAQIQAEKKEPVNAVEEIPQTESEHKLAKRSLPTISYFQDQAPFPDWYQSHQDFYTDDFVPEASEIPHMLSENDVEYWLNGLMFDEADDEEDYFTVHNMIFSHPLRRRRRSTDEYDRMLLTNAIDKTPLDTDKIQHDVFKKKKLKKITDEDSSLEVPKVRKIEKQNFEMMPTGPGSKKEDPFFYYLKAAYEALMNLMKNASEFF